MWRIEAVITVLDRVIIPTRVDPRPSRGGTRALEQIVLYDDPFDIARYADGIPGRHVGAVAYGIVLDDNVGAEAGIGYDANGIAPTVLHRVVTDDVVP